MTLWLVRPPRGKYAKAWRELRERCPYLADARVLVDLGGHLQVDLHWSLVPLADRVERVAQTARDLDIRPQSAAYDGPPRKVTHWLVTVVNGVTTIVSAQVCECHDGIEATLGHFADMDDVIAKVAGDALREMVPAEHHPQLAAAEALLDTAKVLQASSPAPTE